jgi:hypothetical protein
MPVRSKIASARGLPRVDYRTEPRSEFGGGVINATLCAMLVPMLLLTPAPSRPPDVRRSLDRRLYGVLSRPALWYAGFAVYAAGVALFSGPGLDRWWGTWAAPGYAAAALVAAVGYARGHRRAAQAAALAVALAGALIAPLTWLATREPLTSDVSVVMRAGVLLARHGTPYLPAAQLAHGGWLAYNPYLPVMAVFGLPKALGFPGLLGDTRPWLAAVTFLLLVAAFRITVSRRPVSGRMVSGRAGTWRTAGSVAAFALASPIMAFPLAMGITDPPVIALICLSLALLMRAGGTIRASGTIRADGTMRDRGMVLAAIVLGVACAMKYTAWPALAIIVVMVASRDGVRAAARFTASTLGSAVVLSLALAPAALRDAKTVLLNTVAYPLGLTSAHSPAASPLPGHLLATLGPAGHLAALGLLAVSGVAIVVSLVAFPPSTPPQAAARIALALAALFALGPASRFGYFVYPLALFGWAAFAGFRPRRLPLQTRRYPGEPARRKPAGSETGSWPREAPRAPERAGARS